MLASSQHSNLVIIAHRGWSANYPENTMLAFTQAASLGCSLFEFDIAFTKDKRIVIFHDSKLERTTNGNGTLANCTYNELRHLDAGSWFSPEFTGEKIPLLDEILLLGKKETQLTYIIEIKLEYWEAEDNKDTIEKKLLELLEKYGMEERVVISSFQWGFLKRIQICNPKIKTALLYRKDISKIDPRFQIPPLYETTIDALNFEKLQAEYTPYSFHPYCKELNTELIKKCHAKDVQVFTFTINTMEDRNKYTNMGINGFFTDKPNLFLG